MQKEEGLRRILMETMGERQNRPPPTDETEQIHNKNQDLHSQFMALKVPLTSVSAEAVWQQQDLWHFHTRLIPGYVKLMFE